MDPIEWNKLKNSIACNGDRSIQKDDYENYPNGRYSWEFSNDLPYRQFYNIHQAIELGWRLLAPPEQQLNAFGIISGYEWWLTKD